MNPPWVKIGTVFIDKGISLLKENGSLVCIIGYNQFTSFFKDKKGTFLDLNKRGTFQRIEVFKDGTKRDIFNGKGDWCWFIWHNSKESPETTIVNKLGHEFKYKLSGIENYVPQTRETPGFVFFEGQKLKRYTNGTIASPHILKEDVVLFDITKNKKELKYQKKGEKLFKPSTGLPWNTENIIFMEKILKIENIHELYTSAMGGGYVRLPLLRTN